MKTINLKKGFTALELLVVLAIIGILMSIALVGIDLSRERSRDNVRISDIQLITLALEQYQEACRQYPAEIYGTLAPTGGGCPSGVNWYSFMPEGETPVGPDGVQYKYAGIQGFVGSPRCVGYHLGVELEQNNNKYLTSDDDGNTTASPPCGGNGFQGDEAIVGDPIYDVIQSR